MSADENRIEWEAWFSGKVQGVGFRYETLNVARGYAVTGFVENLTDGRVHLLAEGDEREATDFLTALQEHLSDYIRETETARRPSNGSHPDFRIRR